MAKTKKRKIDEIQEQITPEVNKRVLKEVSETDMPDQLQKWIDEYDKFGERKAFIWKWLHMINLDWYYVDLDKNYLKSLAEVKTLYNLFNVLLNDTAQVRNRKELLDLLLEIPFQGSKLNTDKLNSGDKDYFEYTLKVWNHIEGIVSKYPRYKEFYELYMFDTRQLLNAIRYMNIIYNDPNILNSKESWLYLTHGMQIIVDFDLDLMCTQNKNMVDMGEARHAVLTLQNMGRIGNWISTWKREIPEGDFSSAVVVYALNTGIVSLDELKNKDNNKVIKRIEESGAEEYWLNEWEWLRKELDNFSRDNRLISNKKIVEKGEYFIRMHLTSKGYK